MGGASSPLMPDGRIASWPSDNGAAMADSLRELILETVPADGTPIGNTKLMRALDEAAPEHGVAFSEEAYWEARDALVAEGVLAKARGRGGAVRRIAAADAESFGLDAQAPPEADPDTGDTGSAARSGRRPSRKKSASRRASTGDAPDVLAYAHDERRLNNPEVGMVDPDTDPDEGRTRWAYDPHIDPALQFDSGRAEIEHLIDEALASGDADTMRGALQELKRRGDAYLNWTGKAESTNFDVDLVSLHVHERIDPQTLLRVARKRMRDAREEGRSQADMFRAWFEDPLPYREAIEFYKHDKGWMNRLIAGDSLQVMNSLIEKESMAGQVQMIYLDPPYGIRYGSNFQPFVNKRNVKDGNDEDLTQEPEMIKAFRDTWELGIHSYLTYMRDRLLISRDLLAESGSIFVQISDDNLHHIKEIMDEVFGSTNCCSLIAFTKTTGLSSDTLADRCDYLLWYARDIDACKFRPQFHRKIAGEAGAQQYEWVRHKNGSISKFQSIDEISEEDQIFNHDNLTSFLTTPHLAHSFSLNGNHYSPGAATQWKTTQRGLQRLREAGRLFQVGNTLRYIRLLDDFPIVPYTSLWTDTGISGFADPKVYAVQTSSKVIERCTLMTTDPGDLVLDPTCGSGTTAVVAEKWGRRWITCDTSRVAITLARQRLMTQSYDWYELKYPHEGLKGGFIYKTVPHVTLKAIANNPDIDEIHARMHPEIEVALADLNAALRGAPPTPFTVTEGGRKGQAVDFTAAEDAIVELPSGEGAPAGALLEWEVPFELPDDWPEAAREAFDRFHAARQAMQQRMDESIANNAEQEVLYDRPEVAKDKLRVTGPFTVEAVPFPSVRGLDQAEGPAEADAAVARSGETARQHSWRDELLKAGVRGQGGQTLRFAELETLPDTRYLHCDGHLDSGERVVVSLGPEYAPLEQRQVEMAIREAEKLFPRPKMIVFCAFSFDPEAAKDIDAQKGITALKAQMNTDLLTEDLRKKERSSQAFWLVGQPDVEVRAREDGRFEVEVHGFDYFDTGTGELISGGKGKIAAWLLDTDYDERSLYPRQVFFPMAGAKDGWRRLRKDIRAQLDDSALETLHGTVSLPFEAEDQRRIAVKIVDDRGIESLKVMALD